MSFVSHKTFGKSVCRWRHKIRKIAVKILQSVVLNNRPQNLREILRMVIIDSIINTILGRLTLGPAVCIVLHGTMLLFLVLYCNFCLLFKFRFLFSCVSLVIKSTFCVRLSHGIEHTACCKANSRLYLSCKKYIQTPRCVDTGFGVCQLYANSSCTTAVQATST